MADWMDGFEVRFIGLTSPTAARIQAGGHPCQGLYVTAKGAAPKTAVIATHYNVDFSEHYLAPLFAERGFGFLGWNTRFRGAEDLFLIEHALIDIAVGVRWLKHEAGIERIVILGNSGGGSLMGAYQAEATAPTLADRLSGAGREALANLPPADLYISLNAHQGRPEVLTDWMDASVTDETDPWPPTPTSIRSTRRTARRTRKRSSAAIAPPSARATSALPIGPRASSLASTPPARRIASSRCSAAGAIFASWTRRSIRRTGGRAGATAATQPRLTSPRVSAAPTACAPGCRCGVWRPRCVAASRT